MKDKIKKYIKSLPTINKQKKQIKALKEENRLQQIEIDNQALEIVDLQDKDTMIAKVKRLELVNRHHWKTIKELRKDNKKLREGKC